MHRVTTLAMSHAAPVSSVDCRNALGRRRADRLPACLPALRLVPTSTLLWQVPLLQGVQVPLGQPAVAHGAPNEAGVHW